MIYEILENEVVINTILADLPFMVAHYPLGNYREVVQPEPPTPPVLPELVIISVTGAIYDAAKHEITTTEGTAITVNTEIHVGGVIYTPFTGTFRVPVVATDGREKVVLANVVSGAAAITWTPKDSGIWEITQARINRDIPEVQHLSFADIKLFVLEA